MKRRHVYDAFRPLSSLIAAVDAVKPELIVPCDDRAVAHLHRLYDVALQQAGAKGQRLASLIQRSLGAPGAYGTVRSRYEFLKVAGECGILIPDMFQLSATSDVSNCPQDRPLPWVMKTDGSWGGHGVKIVRSYREARQALSELNNRTEGYKIIKRLLCNRDPYWLESLFDQAQSPVTVQGYVPGRPANRAVFCSQGEVVAGVTVEVLVAQGPTGAANVVRIVENRQISEVTRVLARRLRLSGYHGFDFVLEERTNRAFLLELNPRCTPPCHLPIRGEQDLSAAVFSQLRPGEKSPPKLEVSSDVVAYFPQAWQLDPRNSYLSTGYHSVPWEEPALVRELMRLPFPDRSILARLSDRLRRLSLASRSSRLTMFADRDEVTAASQYAQQIGRVLQ